MQPTSDGGYILAGATTGDAWVLRLDTGGDIVWQKTYGDGFATSVQVTADGGYVVAGSSSAGAWVLRLDAGGNVLWQETYMAWLANSVQVTVDGGYVVAGITDGFGAGGSDAWVLKLDASGSVLWQKAYGGTNDDSASEVQLTADGGYAVAGYTYSYGAGNSDAWVLKLDAAGNVLWQKTFGGPRHDGANSLQPTADGGYVVAGYTNSFHAGDIYSNNDAWILKLDAGGDIVWQKTYGGTSDDSASQVLPTADGGYVVAGQWDRLCTNTCGGKAAFLKLDASGNVVWQRAYGGHRFSFVQPTGDGGYVVAGTGRRTGLLQEAGVGWVLKLDADGAIAGCAYMETSNASVADSNAITANSTAAPVGTGISPVSRTPAVADTTMAPTHQCYDPSPASRLTAVEYYHSGYGHYFVTALPPEIAALDAGVFHGWTRTGESFQVYGLDPAAASVCRFWSGQTFAPKSSHFYTPYVPECAYLKQQGVWQYEGDVFALAMPVGPAGQGACATATQPLYRAYNNGQSGAPNHRYTIDPAVLDAMIAQGWIMEGEASTRVFACVPAPE